MKKILFLLLFTSAIYAQTSTGQEQSFPYGILNESAQTVVNPNTLVTHGADGTYGKASVNNIPISIAVQDSLNKKINLPTGFLQGLQLSINVDPTKFNIAAGYYVVTDFTNLVQPVVKIITYPGATGLTPAYLATANSTYIALDINGNVVSSAAPFTNADRRTLAIVGNVVHSNNTTINVTNEIKAPIVATTNQLHDFMRAIGFLNEEGNIYSPNGANLQINKSVGKIFGMGINSADYLNPHQLSIPTQTALTFAYRLRGGTQYANTTLIDPNNYDNAGVLTSVPVGNRWTIQRINLFQSGLTRIQYGQTVYTSYNDAVTALPTQSFVTEQNIADNAVFRCYLIVQQGTTNLASAVAAGTALFVPVDKFGNVIGNGSVALTYSNIIAALGFTPENVANKSDTLSASNTLYPNNNAVIGGLALKADVSQLHNPVTIGTANGLSLSTQQLSLGLASSGVTGALSGTDWTAFNGKFNAPSGLTTNYLPKWNGSGFGNSQVFNNGTNVGIGTSSPNFTTAGRTVTDVNGSSQSMLALSVGGVGKGFLFYTGTDILLSNESNGSIKLNTNGTQKAEITSSGNVLLDTTTDNGVDKLQVNGSTKTTALTLSTTPTTSAGTYDILTRNSSTGVVEKKLNANFVHTSGSETIAGIKTFSNTPITNTAKIDFYDNVTFGGTASLEMVDAKLTAYTTGNASYFFKVISGSLSYKNSLNFYANISNSTLTADRTYTLPNASGTIALAETIKPYKVYTALLSQSGTSAPTATVLENTLGGTIVWTRVNPGIYSGTLTGAFTTDKTILLNNNPVGGVFTNIFSSVNTITIQTRNYSNAQTDDGLSNTSIEIRVYN